MVDEIRLWAQSVEWLEAILSVAVVLLPLLLVAYFTFFAGEKAVKSGAAFYRAVRTFFDEPTDPAILLIAQRTGMSPEQIVGYLTRNLDELFPEVKQPGGAVK